MIENSDNLLAQAINQERFGGCAQTLERAFTPNEAGDLSAGERDVPLVYGPMNRYGSLETTGSL